MSLYIWVRKCISCIFFYDEFSLILNHTYMQGRQMELKSSGALRGARGISGNIRTSFHPLKSTLKWMKQYNSIFQCITLRFQGRYPPKKKDIMPWTLGVDRCVKCGGASALARPPCLVPFLIWVDTALGLVNNILLISQMECSSQLTYFFMSKDYNITK